MTGGVAQNGKQLLIALELWRHDINAKGGLLGRPVEFVYYDDQSNPTNVPGIYTKLINIDKVDLLLGPYATNMAAAAMPVIMESNKLTIGMMAVSINRHFNYPRYFSMLSLGPDGVRAFSERLFRSCGGAEAKAADRCHPVGRRRIRAHFRRRRAGERCRRRLRNCLRQELSARHDGLRADRARAAGDESRPRLCRRLSAGHGRHRACGERDRA